MYRKHLVDSHSFTFTGNPFGCSQVAARRQRDLAWLTAVFLQLFVANAQKQSFRLQAGERKSYIRLKCNFFHVVADAHVCVVAVGGIWSVAYKFILGK
jgi:hypothetical protein